MTYRLYACAHRAFSALNCVFVFNGGFGILPRAGIMSGNSFCGVAVALLVFSGEFQSLPC